MFVNSSEATNLNSLFNLSSSELGKSVVQSTLRWGIFENGDFITETHRMFSVNTTPERLRNATTIDHFEFVFEENSVGKIT